ECLTGGCEGAKNGGETPIEIRAAEESHALEAAHNALPRLPVRRVAGVEGHHRFHRREPVRRLFRGKDTRSRKHGDDRRKPDGESSRTSHCRHVVSIPLMVQHSARREASRSLSKKPKTLAVPQWIDRRA